MNIQALYEACLNALENATIEELRTATEKAVHDSRNYEIMGEMDIFDNESEDVTSVHIYRSSQPVVVTGYMKTTVYYDHDLSNFGSHLEGGSAA